MLGYALADAWVAQRDHAGRLQQDWFARSPHWAALHLHNLEKTFRLSSTDGGETYGWIPMDVWCWAETVVMFGGIWVTRNNQGETTHAFDAMYLSMPSGIEQRSTGTDLVLLEDFDPRAAVPAWYQHPLAQHVSPLWWRTNKDLPWAKRLIALIASKTDRLQWEHTTSVQHLLDTVPMFKRAWIALPQIDPVVLHAPAELPIPSWAQVATNDDAR